jgi:hypothetical protein
MYEIHKNAAKSVYFDDTSLQRVKLGICGKHCVNGYTLSLIYMHDPIPVYTTILKRVIFSLLPKLVLLKKMFNIVTQSLNYYILLLTLFILHIEFKSLY